MNNRNKWGQFVQESPRYARFATERGSMVMHFSLSNSGGMSETCTAAELDFSEGSRAHAGWYLLLWSQYWAMISSIKSNTQFFKRWCIGFCMAGLFCLLSNMISTGTDVTDGVMLWGIKGGNGGWMDVNRNGQREKKKGRKVNGWEGKWVKKVHQLPPQVFHVEKQMSFSGRSNTIF